MTSASVSTRPEWEAVHQMTTDLSCRKQCLQHNIVVATGPSAWQMHSSGAAPIIAVVQLTYLVCRCLSVLLTCCQPWQMLTAVMTRDHCTNPLHQLLCKTADHELGRMSKQSFAQ